ncbi:MAG: NUDIX domain-containing protein [Comamonadaceae bacterium]|nr:NUDIX domain-containing protein [Comamonadaceae bacterium]
MSQPPRILRADAHLRRTDAAGHAVAGDAARPVVDVAVGVLIRPQDGRFLLTSRPAGKVYAGYWEFPGGKLEAGETVAQALARELHEELGLHLAPEAIVHWREQMVDYPHALVRLHFCKVHAWQGVLQMREGQAFSWQNLPVQVAPVLPGALPVLQWLAEEAASSGAPAPL